LNFCASVITTFLIRLTKMWKKRKKWKHCTKGRFQKHFFMTFSWDQDEKLFWHTGFGKWRTNLSKLSSYLVKFITVSKWKNVGETESQFLATSFSPATFCLVNKVLWRNRTVGRVNPMKLFSCKLPYNSYT